MKIYTLPRYAVIRMAKNGHIDFDKVNVVSINTYYSRYGECNELQEMQEVLKGHEDNVLFCQFDDMTPEQSSKLPNNFLSLTIPRLFNRDMAIEILRFAEKTNNEGKDLIVHCTAGVSRSAAVSFALNGYINAALGGHNDDFEWTNNLYGCERSPCANPHVSRIMNNVIEEFLL